MLVSSAIFTGGFLDHGIKTDRLILRRLELCDIVLFQNNLIACAWQTLLGMTIFPTILDGKKDGFSDFSANMGQVHAPIETLNSLFFHPKKLSSITDSMVDIKDFDKTVYAILTRLWEKSLNF